MTHESGHQMIDVYLDFETYYSTEYSLRRMEIIEYVAHPDFQVHGVGIALNGGKPKWISNHGNPDKVRAALDSLPWSKINLVGHNLFFDGYILSQIFGHKPRRYSDTLGMARFVIGGAVANHSLGTVYDTLSRSSEGKSLSQGLLDTKGLKVLTDEQDRQLGHYCTHGDIEQTRFIYAKLKPTFPAKESLTLDWATRMFTSPRLALDDAPLRLVDTSERRNKAEAVARTGYNKTQLSSNQQFAAILESHGAKPPTKISPSTGRETLDFSKDRREFTDIALQSDTLADLIAARLAVKSTLMETRAKRLLTVYDSSRNRQLPVPLNFAGALQTGRLSGGGKLNLQNLKRGSLLREAIVAPAGHVVVAIDLSNIELRTNMVMCREQEALDKLRKGADLYCDFASKLYNMKVTKHENPDERNVGKVSELSLGYGSGWFTFKGMVWSQQSRVLTDSFAQSTVSLYRRDKPNVVRMWRNLTQCLSTMRDGGVPANPLDAPVEWGKNTVTLPSGFRLKYFGLKDTQQLDDEGKPTGKYDITFTRKSRSNPSGRVKIWGGFLLENLNQSLAREVLTDMMWRIHAQSNLLPALQVHDELVYVVPEHHAQQFLDYALTEMKTAPDFWPQLPVDAEGAIGYNYGEAK